MTEPVAAPLEARHRAAVRPRHVATVGRLVAQQRAGRGDLQHVFGVRLPVGRHPQHAARAQPVRDQCDELGLHDATLVVALLGPRVREIQQHLVERAGRDALLQHFDRIAADCAHVAELEFLGAQHEVADPRPVHLEPQEIALRVRCGQRDQ